MTVLRRCALLMTAAALLSACGESSKLPFQAGVGPKPQLPEPTSSVIPTLKVSKAVGWSGSDMPKAPDGFKVQALANDLQHPRWLYSLPNGDVLVAEKGWVSPDYKEELGAAEMKKQEITIKVDLGLGDGKSTVWTCDLTHQYISINADYRS